MFGSRKNARKFGYFYLDVLDFPCSAVGGEQSFGFWDFGRFAGESRVILVRERLKSYGCLAGKKKCENKSGKV